MNEIDAIEPAQTFRPSAAIDPQRLEYLWTLAERMARSVLVPESLRTIGPKGNKKDLPPETIVANVFAVVEQADRWNQSPFALLACAAIVHGKLGFEGKVISAVLKSRYGIDLDYDWEGDGENRKITVSGCKPGTTKVLTVTGTVKAWKTTGDGSPWRPADYDKMLAYRGAREFARLHEPSAILGVLGDDEILAIGMERQAQLARDVTPSLNSRFGGASKEGFNAKQLTHSGQEPMEMVDQRTGEILKTEVQREAADRKTSPAPAASAKPSSHDDGGGGSSSQDGRPTNSQGAADRSTANEGGRAGPSSRLPAEVHQKYASALARMQSPESVKKADAQFWKEHGSIPLKGTPDYELGAAIFNRQMSRAKGETDAEGLLDEIHADIAKSYGTDL